MNRFKKNAFRFLVGSVRGLMVPVLAQDIVVGLVIVLVAIPMAVYAQEDPVSPAYKQDIKITGLNEGPYNLKASIKPKTENVPMGLAKKGGQATSAQDDKGKKPPFTKYIERSFFGSASDDVPFGDPYTTTLVNELVDSKGPIVSNPATTNTTPSATTPPRAMDPESHHHQSGGGPEDHHKLPTDGSPGSEDITNGAINVFYENLPGDITRRLGGMGTDPLATVHGAGDPYAPYAIAMSRGDFSTMRRMAQDDAITDLRERIAMLGLAGATALRNMANSKGGDTFPAKDTLRKIAEDLHYAGQGLDENNPNQAKLKAVCEDISRVWSNMTKPNK
jgi:hypothetical protein